MSEATGIYAYVVIFVALVAAGLGFPIPEEIPVVTGGALCEALSEAPGAAARCSSNCSIPPP